jgi:2-iminobutanoate/2-iminopropanoate deaminase
VAPVGAYSHQAWIRAGSDILYIAGQVGLRPDGSLPADMTAQADEAFANVVRILEAGDMTPRNLVKMNLYLVYGQSVDAVRAARAKHFGDVRPASTLIYIPQLIDPKYLIEIDGVACR